VDRLSTAFFAYIYLVGDSEAVDDVTDAGECSEDAQRKAVRLNGLH